MKYLAIVISVLFLASCAEQPERTIALTFDDAAMGDGSFFTGEERTARLVEALTEADVDGAMFFVTSGNTLSNGESGSERLNAYTDAGHVLANHSHSHPHLSTTEADEYIADVDRAIEFLAGFDGVEPYFRFPFLDEGREVGKRDALRDALRERGLINGYVTVDTWDWSLVNLAAQAHAAGVEFDIEDLRDLYVDVITKSTEFYDAMAQETLGRSPHHVLLLHENDLAALFIGDLVAELRERGFRIIPATEAFTDPIVDREPDTLYLGQGRVAALAHEAGWDPANLRSPTENNEYLLRRFEAEVATLPAKRQSE